MRFATRHPPCAQLYRLGGGISSRLYQLPAGFPAVVITEEPILAHGAAAPPADARTQAEFAARGVAMPEVEGDWDTVHGAWISFPEPGRNLPPLDRLEGFRPDGDGLYRRALVAAQAATGVEAVWVYHMGGIGRGRRLEDGCWLG